MEDGSSSSDNSTILLIVKSFYDVIPVKLLTKEWLKQISDFFWLDNNKKLGLLYFLQPIPQNQF